MKITKYYLLVIVFTSVLFSCQKATFEKIEPILMDEEREQNISLVEKKIEKLQKVKLKTITIQQKQVETFQKEEEEEPVALPPYVEEECECEEVVEFFTIVEDMPYIKTCEILRTKKERNHCTEQTVRAYLNQHLRYANTEKEGMELISYVIDRNGLLKNIQIVKSHSKINAKEVIRVLKSMPFEWEVGMQRSLRVAVKYHLPVRFELESRK